MHTTGRHTFQHQMIAICNYEITIKVGNDAESCPGWFCFDLFRSLSDILECLGHLLMAPYPLDKKQTAVNHYTIG